MMKTKLNAPVIAAACVWLAATQVARADGERADGPVAAAARAALETNDAAPALKWVEKARAPELRAAFQKTLAVRRLGPEARELADRYFSETLLRIHRTGALPADAGPRPAGAGVEAASAKADEALISGSVKPLAQSLADAVAEGIRQRFARAHAAKENADSGAEGGRRYVEAYVEFIHYVERVAHAAGPSAVETNH